MTELKDFNPADYKVVRYGETPEREKRKLTPELDKATAQFSPLQTFAKNAVNAATFGQHDRLQSWLSGTNLKDENEFTTRTNEANPKSALAGNVAGHVLQAVPLSAGAAATVPALAANTARAAMAREGALGLATSAASEKVKSAEGRGDFDLGNVLKGGVSGVVGGGVGHTLPGLLGHAPSKVAGTARAPLDTAQKAGMGAARDLSTARGFTGDAALDAAQLARLSNDRSLAGMAANMERIKGRANPYIQALQDKGIKNADITAGPGLTDIHRAIANAPTTPSNMPGSIPVSAGIPFLKGIGRVTADIPWPKMTARNTRAAELLRDPATVETLGRTTGAQTGSAAASRVGIDTLEDLRRRYLSGS